MTTIANEKSAGLVEDLLRRNLREVFGERDAARRRQALARLWHAQGVFVDPHGRYVGVEAIAAAIASLHEKLPGFVFRERGEPQAFNGIGRLGWGFGPAGEAPRVNGVDILEERDGRIERLYVFLE